LRRHCHGVFVEIHRVARLSSLALAYRHRKGGATHGERENALSVKICFDKDLAVASILLVDWASPLVEHLQRYFVVRENMLRLDYSHLPVEDTTIASHWQQNLRKDREHFVLAFGVAARHGPVALTLTILGHGSTGISNSKSIQNANTYRSAVEAFREEVLREDSIALRELIMAEISPGSIWVSWLLGTSFDDRSRFLDDQEIMSALVANTSTDDVIHALQLVAPTHGQSSWAFEELVQQNWQHVQQYLEHRIGMSSDRSDRNLPNIVLPLFANSPIVQSSRWACEQVLERADSSLLPQLIQHSRAILAEDVRGLFLRWDIHSKAEKDDDLKECVAKAFSTLATLLADAMPSDLALAAAWHKFGDPARPGQQSVAACLRELPSEAWDREALWGQLGPAAREAWRQDLFDQARGEPELARGLLDFACRWLEQTAFAEVEPVLLRLMDDEDQLAFAVRLASASPRQVQLRAKGLVRSSQGALDLEGQVGHGDDSSALPSVGAQTWLGDPTVERVIHRVLSQIEEKFCREYQSSWGEDEEAHTARLLALTQEAVGNTTRQLLQLSATTRAKYPSLSVKVRQPSKREEGAKTPAGAPLGADVLFLTHIVDEGTTVIRRATLMQVKKRHGTGSGKGFSSTIGIDLKQCEDMLKQSEHAYYLIATPASPRPTLWVAPARLVRNLTQMHRSKASVVAIQVRDASCSYADFFLQDLIGLWAGDEDESVIALANGDPKQGRTPRHIVELTVSRQSG
jgi:hypothetical protein